MEEILVKNKEYVGIGYLWRGWKLFIYLRVVKYDLCICMKFVKGWRM